MFGPYSFWSVFGGHFCRGTEALAIFVGASLLGYRFEFRQGVEDGIGAQTGKQVDSGTDLLSGRLEQAVVAEPVVADHQDGASFEEVRHLRQHADRLVKFSLKGNNGLGGLGGLLVYHLHGHGEASNQG